MDKQMNELRLCLANDIRGVNLEEDPDLRGFKLKDPQTGWTLYTAYVAEPGFSSYVAIADIWKGIDCEDERPLATQSPLFTAVSKIKADQIANGSQLYAQAPAVNSNPQRAPHYINYSPD